jgi:uncharacterized peroxidase-related enzyme
MRLDVLDHGHGRRNRLALRLMRALAGAEPDAVVKTALYRPRFFGRPWLQLIRSTMRGHSAWTPGERELFGAFISRLNTCRYCAGIHIGAATLIHDHDLTPERLDRWQDGTFSPRVTAALALLEKATLAPDTLGPADITQLRSAGVSDDAIADALYLAFVFNTVNRLANAFGYTWATEAEALKIATILNRTGYRMPDFLLS